MLLESWNCGINFNPKVNPNYLMLSYFIPKWINSLILKSKSLIQSKSFQLSKLY